MNCVNQSSKEFKEILKVANINPHILAAKVSVWQDKNGIDNFPTISDLDINILEDNYQKESELVDNSKEIVGKIISISKVNKEKELGIKIPINSYSNQTIINIRKKIIFFNNKNVNNKVHYRAVEILRDDLPTEKQKGKSPLYREFKVVKHQGTSKQALARLELKNKKDNNQPGLFDNPASLQIDMDSLSTITNNNNPCK
jgi:hypothetical protein